MNITLLPEAITVKLSQVVFDDKIYPRQKHDPVLVQRYAESIESIESRNNYISLSSDFRLIDGRHRHLAYLTVASGEDREIPAHVYPVLTDDAIFDLAVELNSDSGWQMTDEDKRRAAIKMYARADRKPQAEIAISLGVSLKKINSWLSDILRQEREERESRIFDLWLACTDVAVIANDVNQSENSIREYLRKMSESCAVQDSALFRNYEQDESEKSGRRVYNLWNFAKANNEVRHFGNIPPEIIDNLLYLYTQRFDIVFDPFGGGGSTIDKCIERQRRYYVSDLTPIPARADIRPHDITTGLPADLPVPDLVFLDPPYWKQAEEKYSEKETDLGNVDLECFLTTLADIAKAVKRKWSNAKRPTGTLALIIGPLKQDGEYVDLALLCYERLSKYLTLKQRIIVPYSTQVHGGAYVKQAKEKKELLYLYRDLLVFGYQNGGAT